MTRLESRLSQAPRFYLDHAATSWPKPPGSLEACIAYQTENGAAAGRGVYSSAESSSRLIRDTRRTIASLIHAPGELDIALCSNGTQALNAAILGLLHSKEYSGCHVVTTATEHNSVLRPLELAVRRCGISWSAVPCNEHGIVDPAQIKLAMKPNTRLVIINHASNVTGAIQDLSAIAQIANEHDAILLVDAAQTLGYLPIDVTAQGIGILAAPGHKGAGGMLGTGLLYVERSIQPMLENVWIGGTGLSSETIQGPFDWLSSIESGNSNLPGIASLRAGVDWIQQQPRDNLLELWTQLIIEAISRQKKLTLVGPRNNRIPVISITGTNASCHEMAMLLDSACNVEARSGLHCAGLIHTYLETMAKGGTLRLSLGHTSTQADVDTALTGIELLGSL